MSAMLVASEIAEFLRSPEPQILCVVGKWGVGKTFAWQHYLRNAQAASAVTFDRYAYVSLFGKTSIADVRDAIVEATVDSRNPGVLPNLESFESFVSSAFKLINLAKPLLPFIPKTTGYGEGVNRLLYLAVRKQVVCIDDLERAGEKLRIEDILGLASELKERKECKVVLLLNQEALSDRERFQQQLEKVADVSLAFLPSPEEAADIALAPDQAMRDELRLASINLGMVNIRVIRKAARLIRKLAPMLSTYNPHIAASGVRTVVLGCYSVFQPDLAPPLPFIRSYSHMAAIFRRNAELPLEEEAYGKVLTAYGFSSTDDLDSALFDAVETGLIDENRVQEIAAKKHEQFETNEQSKRYTQAWMPYHDSFDDNEEEVASTLERSVLDGLQSISPHGLSAVVKLLRDLGQDARADHLIVSYMRERQAPARYWNIAEHHMGNEPIDAAIVAAFAARFAERRELPPLGEAVARMAAGDGYNPEHMEAMANASADDYHRLFKSPPVDGVTPTRLVEGALFFQNVINATEQMQQITAHALEAVRRIAAENRLNTLRLARFLRPV